MGDPLGQPLEQDAGELAIEERRHGRAIVVSASGDVDLASAGLLREALDRSRSDDAAPVVLDLSAVPFMDSSGLAVVMGAADHLGQRLFVVLAEGSPVAKLFALTGVDDSLQIAASTSEALAAADADGASA